MNPVRTHRAVSGDGTPVVARVEGDGPPLVLTPAGPGDSETTWHPMLPWLSRRFECYLLNTRGRGLSGDDPDHTPARMVDDIRAFTESIGEPVFVAEWGSFIGGAWGLFAAQEPSSAIRAAATFDPLPIGLESEDDAARLNGIFGQVAELAEKGQLDEAARTFVKGMARNGYYRPEDMADGATFEFWSAARANILPFLRELELAEEAVAPDGAGSDPLQPDAADPTALGRTTVPVLVLYGARSHPMNVEFARYVADALPDARLQAVEGAAHYAPHTHPEAVAGEMVAFFEEALQPA
jgi:pimeloyl-ACP methyl ester carboxylesterase